MLVVFSSFFVPDTKIFFSYNFGAPYKKSCALSAVINTSVTIIHLTRALLDGRCEMNCTKERLIERSKY